MKKILSLILCLVLVASALVSCGGGEVTTPEADRPNRTLRMAIIVADDYVDENGDLKQTTQEGVAAMQKAFNEYTEVLLATHVEFECIKASEYKTRMTAIMNEVADEKGRQDAGKEDAMANAGDSTGTELVDDENKFPAASKAQFDILLIYDEAMYKEYVKNGWLVGLNSHLTSNFKPLNTKILTGAKNLSMIDGVCYGVPANTAYGSYTYLKINKKVEELYNVDYTSITSLADAYSIITMMQMAENQEKAGLAYWQNEYPEKFSVIGTPVEKFSIPNVQYLSSGITEGRNDQSLFGVTYSSKLDMSSIAKLDNAKILLEDDDYVRSLKLIFNGQLEENNYFLDESLLAEGETAADWDCLISLAEGDYALSQSDEDYWYVPLSLPNFGSGEIFGGMLAVSTASIDEKRSLEIVQELMTNATKSDLLNILLYGDQETNYYMEDGCVVYRKNSNYHVDQGYLFGNLCELAYPCKNFGQTEDTYVYIANHINDLSQRKPLFDDYFHLYFRNINADKWKEFDAYSKDMYKSLMDCTTMEDFDARILEILDDMKAPESEEETGGVFYVNFYALVDPYATEATFSTLGGAFMKYTSDRGDSSKPLDPWAAKETGANATK